MNVGQRAAITVWYQDVEALRLRFDTHDHWWAFRQKICDDIGDYCFIGRSPPNDRIVFRGSVGARLEDYAETFVGFQGKP